MKCFLCQKNESLDSYNEDIYFCPYCIKKSYYSRLGRPIAKAILTNPLFNENEEDFHAYESHKLRYYVHRFLFSLEKEIYESLALIFTDKCRGLIDKYIQEEVFSFDLNVAFQEDKKDEDSEETDKRTFYLALKKEKGYKAYLSTVRWKCLINHKHIRTKSRDQLTNLSTDLEGHHRTYVNVGTDREIDDIILITHNCHDELHQTFEYDQENQCFKPKGESQ